MMTDKKVKILDLQETGVYCCNVLCLTVYMLNKVITMHTKIIIYICMSSCLSSYPNILPIPRLIQDSLPRGVWIIEVLMQKQGWFKLPKPG